MGLMNNVKINRVKIVGVHTAEDTKVLVTHNMSIYSILVEYFDGHVELKECTFKDMKQYEKYLYID